MDVGYFEEALSLAPSPEAEYYDEPTEPSPIESLPYELLEKIAQAVCRQQPPGPPSALLNLLVLSRRFYDVLGPRNEAFYAELFRERFDSRSAERRWRIMQVIEAKREKRALLESVMDVKPAADDELKLPASLYSTGFTRPSSPSEFLSSSDELSPWEPFTSRDLATELKRRYTILTRMRRAVKSGQIPPSSSRPNSPRLQAFTPAGTKTALPEPDELTQILWTCYLMLLENDGRNLANLFEYADIRTYMRLFYEHSLLSEALNPGWPRQTPGRALGLWIGWLGADDLTKETPDDAVRRFFVLKPYVFGAHKFDAFHAPWTLADLPVSRSTHPVRPPPEGPFDADLRPRTQAQLVTHMGRKIEMAPPILAHAAIFSFFFRVEQDPNVSTDLAAAAVGAPANFQNAAVAGGRHGHQQQQAGGGRGLSNKPVKTTLPELASRIHDADFVRLASCVDPYSSRGLPPLRCRGMLAGSWEGRFSFFDFDSYKDMLGGRMRSLYDGPFGDQPQVWKIEERVVRLDKKKGERPGGRGPTLNAGYEIGQAGPARSAQSALSPLMRHASLPAGGSNGSTSSSTASSSGSSVATAGSHRRRTSIEPMSDWPLGDGLPTRASKRSRSVSDEDLRGDDRLADEQEDKDGDYEILLTGSGHSAWGQFLLKGRVRPYDGMFSITKEYTPDSRGRWLYRGYCVGGNLVGRWRDTHTPLDLNGYEGTFLMTRRH